MSRELDARYQARLRWYPRSWRTRHGEAFIGTALAVAEAEGRTRPTMRETVSMAAHGLAARLDLVVDPRVRDAGSTVALTMGAGIALAVSVFGVGTVAGGSEPTSGVHDLGAIVLGAWILALVAALAGLRLAGSVALVCGTMVVVVVPRVLPGWASADGVDRATLILLTCCAVLAIVGRPHRGPWTIGATLGWALLVALAFVGAGAHAGVRVPSNALWSQVGPIWYAAAVAVIAAVVLAATRRWAASFTIVLGLTPLAVTLVVVEMRGVVVGSGSPEVIAIPVAVGLLLLALWNSGLLTLPAPRRDQRGEPTPAA
ncbi:hypothetical protein CLV49_1455 [Labedella gwakjiensis]|uniref:Uncharacterized protein n=1 Tax=Labedella gwakjiensis TaxID=390269 RepID=A0A2P8GV49_9MICO|nr:hypothetical protein [Labedella gwakjiensis]PSL37848.1 hypothetical protein CLV49_1455 [Labedella gwakjiensis]RUQ87580.1 hypothetical protein ELQ93_11925 [Labedella gwakjiensis]